MYRYDEFDHTLVDDDLPLHILLGDQPVAVAS